MSVKGNYKVLILITWSEKKKWPFVDALREEGIECDVIGANFPRGYNTVWGKVFRFWPRYLLIGIKAFIIRKKYDVILPWQQVAGFVYGFFKHLFHSNYPRLIVLKFVYPSRKNPIISKFRYLFVKYVLGATDALWCVSNREIEIRSAMFDYPREKMKFVPIIPTDISDSGQDIVPGGRDGKYILSVGNNRDYGMLIAVMQEIGYPLKIVAQPYNFKGIDIPSDMEVFHTFGQKVIELYQSARFVVIPMNYNHRPGGESVILESMSYGKAIIMTRTVTSNDFITHMDNGILFELDDAGALKAAIKYLLDNPGKMEEMGKKNKKLYEERFSSQAAARAVKENIIELMDGSE